MNSGSAMADHEARRSLSPGMQRPEPLDVQFDVQFDDHNDEKGRRKQATIGWSFAGLFAVTVIATLSLVVLLLSLNPLNTSMVDTGPQVDDHQPPPVNDHPPPPVDEHPPPPQVDDHQPPPQSFRPGDSYILDPSWDFFAPSQAREYQWTITDGEASPDGVRRPMMLINGQFPGPLIEINEGDEVVVNVINQAVNATSLHWHGIFQNGTNWMDGAAGVTQCPIAPGQSYQYKFNVTGQSGTYFYHGHQGVQALDGLVGPMVVHTRREAGKRQLPYSSDRVILLQDWWYDQASGHMRNVLSQGVEDAPTPNTALMNGVNRAVCSDHPGRECTEVKPASLPSMQVAPGERHRLRFINAGGIAWFQVVVDEHNDLQVVEVDGTIVDPVLSSPILISPGQRYSAILKADHEDGAFWLRARMVTSCLPELELPENGIEEAKAIIRYQTKVQTRHDGDDDSAGMDDDHTEDESEEDLVLPQTTSELPFVAICQDLSYSVSFQPSPQEPAPQVADHSWLLRVNLQIGYWRLQRGFLNSSSFRPDLKYPTLNRVLDGLAHDNKSFAMEGVNTAAFDAKSELVISNNKTETVDIILQNMDEQTHPFHLHGNKMWLMAAGHGYFPGYDTLNLKPEGKGLLDASKTAVVRNPLKRDTISVEGFGWVLVRFVADNPGVWLFHCHTLWHAEAGMGMQFVSRIDDLRGLKLPEETRKLCDAPEEELRKGAPPKDEIFFGLQDERHR